MAFITCICIYLESRRHQIMRVLFNWMLCVSIKRLLIYTSLLRLTLSCVVTGGSMTHTYAYQLVLSVMTRAHR
jgi:hypothetical protein